MGHKVLQYQSRFCSKLVDLDDRQVTQDVFKDLDSHRGPQWIVLPLITTENQIFFKILEPGNVGRQCIYAVAGRVKFLIISASLLIPRTLAYICNH